MGSDGGTGEVGPRPGGLMQDPVLLQRMAVQQKGKRQQTEGAVIATRILTMTIFLISFLAFLLSLLPSILSVCP